ncbi:MAG: DUF1294 domain-containing protein [Hespellia sp.]|nr:DUF1294 domain-containing protein [Hespellia sp.]
MEYIWIYLLVVNVLAFFIYGDDKARARRGVWRISERTLILMALIGGSMGALFGMAVFHHKTRHKKFTIGVPFILALQVLIGAMLFFEHL